MLYLFIYVDTMYLGDGVEKDLVVLDHFPACSTVEMCLIELQDRITQSRYQNIAAAVGYGETYTIS